MVRSLGALLHGGTLNAAEVFRVRDTLVFEGALLWPKFLKFICLLVLAASIATFGLLGDSLAVVIGAMIVAPLMLPIMGPAFSVSVGDRSAILSTLLVSLSGIVTAVGVGFLLALPIATVKEPEAIQQIMIRTSPHLLDLMAALVTGMAGAFALAGKDVSDTLPGMAIAVSLVPPLANAGILFALGEPRLASGSLLLFVTNRIAARTYALGQEWLVGSGYRLMSVDAETADGSVHLLLMGDGDLPPLGVLAERAQGFLFGRTLQLKIVESRTLSLATKPA